MTRIAGPRVAAYAGLAAFGLFAGLVAGRVELVVLAAPFALAAVAGAALPRNPELEATLSLDRERVRHYAERFSWEAATQQFLERLVPARSGEVALATAA